MAHNLDQLLAQLTPAETTQFRQLIAHLDSYADLTHLAQATQNHLENIPPQPTTIWHIVDKYVHEVYYYFATAVLYLGNGNFKDALTYFNIAHEGFNTLHKTDLVTQTDYLSQYCDGLLLVQNGNIQIGLQTLQKLQETLQHFEWRHRYETFIAFVEPSILFVSAVQLLTRLDMTSAKSLIDKATKQARYAANTFAKDDPDTFHMYSGLSYHYQCYYHFFYTITEANAFNFSSHIFRKAYFASDFQQAQRFFSLADVESDVVRNILYANKVMELYIDVIANTVSIMDILHKNQEPEKLDIKNFDVLKEQLTATNTITAQITSDESAIYLKIGEQILQKIINTERYFLQSKIKQVTFTSALAAPHDIIHAKEQIARGECDAALDTLMKATARLSDMEDLIILKARHNRLQKQIHAGTVTTEDTNIELNKILVAALQIANSIGGL
jgi:tetratricopeptide (TPR) repeat protein